MTDRLRLLIADDDPEMRAFLRAALTGRRVQVEEVESGAELVQALAERGPHDLVITDVRMSWATGVQALEMARDAGWRTPFLVITAHATAEVRIAAEAFGAQLLEKPFTVERLLGAIDLALGDEGRAAAG